MKKAVLILANWAASWFCLFVVNSEWATTLGFLWFMTSSVVLIRADHKGLMKDVYSSRIGRFLLRED
jgi:hypothetical protein